MPAAAAAAAAAASVTSIDLTQRCMHQQWRNRGLPARCMHRERKCADNNIMISDTIFFFFNCNQHFGNLKTITVSECCSIKLLQYILFEKKYILIFFSI